MHEAHLIPTAINTPLEDARKCVFGQKLMRLLTRRCQAAALSKFRKQSYYASKLNAPQRRRACSPYLMTDISAIFLEIFVEMSQIRTLSM